MQDLIIVKKTDELYQINLILKYIWFKKRERKLCYRI